MKALNKWVVRTESGYVGLAVADTREDAEDWMDELAITGDLLTREEYNQTEQGQADIAAQNARATYTAEMEAKEAERKALSKRLKAQRKAARGRRDTSRWDRTPRT